MTARKWTSTRVVKVWLDVVLVLGAVSAAFLTFWLLIFPRWSFAHRRERRDWT
jgi:hypothetical protein